MKHHIAISDSHPDRFPHGLVDVHVHTAAASGRETRRPEVATMGLPCLHSRAEWESEPLPIVRGAEETLA